VSWDPYAVRAFGFTEDEPKPFLPTMDAPLGKKCGYGCGGTITAGDKGFVLVCSPSIEDAFAHEGLHRLAYHRGCLLRSLGLR
jgi:hypothetical protein